MDRGFMQVYTGNGKGKTTAALGLSLRAVCAGKKVFFCQFMKAADCSELKAEKYLPGFKIEQFGAGRFIFGKPSEKDIEAAEKGLEKAGSILSSGDYDVVVLDEINVAIHCGLFSEDEVIDILEKRSPNTEVVLTGRYAGSKIIEKADLVTEMEEVKHYYSKGITARKGIEF